MAENDQQKTEQKSQKKWEEARDKGELPRSQEIGTLVVFGVLIFYFTMMQMRALEALGNIAADLLRFDKYLGITHESLDDFLRGPLISTAFIVAPLFIGIIVLSALANMGQTGFNLAKNKLQFDWMRLDPVSGSKKLVSGRAWIEGAKSIGKIGIFLYLAYITVAPKLDEIIELPNHDLRYQLAYMMELSLKVGIRIAMLMAAFSLGDYFYQWWQFQERLKMTPAEVKEEMRESEGDPLIRQRIRSIRMEMARKRMMKDVPKADVIVTNPTHYAVALRYDKDKMAAPYVCAKGVEFMAAKIREIAALHGVPIIENPPVARALYKAVKVGHPVPSEFYRVVAELLAFVFLLKRRRKGSPAPAEGVFRPRLKARLPDSAIPPAPETV